MPAINPVYTTQPGQQPSPHPSNNQNIMQPPPVAPVMQTNHGMPASQPQQQQYPGGGGYPQLYPGAPTNNISGSQQPYGAPQHQNPVPPTSTNPFINSTPSLQARSGGITSSNNRYPNPNPMLPPQPPPAQQPQVQPIQNQYAQQQQPYPSSAPQQRDGYVISGQPVNPSNLYPNIPTALTNNNYPQQPLVPPQPQMQQPMSGGGGGLPINSHQNNSYPNHPQNNQHAYNNGGVPQLTSQMNNMSVTQQGFNKLWGIDHADLLKTRQVLPPEGVKSPEIRFQHDYMNHVNCSPE